MLRKSQEKRDYSLGRLFGAEVILKPLIHATGPCRYDHWTRIVHLISDLAIQKLSLREQCCFVIFESFRALAMQIDDSKYGEIALESLSSRRIVRTPEGVALWLAFREKFPTAKVPSGVWKNDAPFSSKEKISLAAVLMETSPPAGPDGDSEYPQKKGTWSSNINFAWDVVLNHLYKVTAGGARGQHTSKNDQVSRVDFEDFWLEVVDRKYSHCQTAFVSNQAQTACSQRRAPRNANTGASSSSSKWSPMRPSPCWHRSSHRIS